MELANLPVDILLLLFDQLAQRDLKRVRLVCRTLHKIVKLRIPRVFLSPNRANIDAFRGVLEHETFRNQVREIISGDARLEFYQRQPLPLQEAILLRENLRLGYRENETDPPRFEHYSHTMKEEDGNLMEIEKSRRKTELWGFDAKDMSLEDSFDLYNHFYDEQQATIKSGEDVDTLMLGLISFPALRKVTVTSETWRMDPLSPKYETPFFRALPPGFQMPIPWPWPGRDFEELLEPKLDKLLLPWEESHEEWRGYQIVVDTLLATASTHKVDELVIDTNYELTGISHQLFVSRDNIGYTQTVQLFQSLQLTTLALCLNTQTAEETNFSCFHNQLLKSALSRLTLLKHLTLSTDIDTKVDDHIHEMEESWVSLGEIIPIEVLGPTLKSLKLCNFFLNCEALYSGLTSCTTLTSIWLECNELDEEFPWRSFMFRIKERLIQNTMSHPTWTLNNPEIVLRSRLEMHDRLDYSAEVQAFLFKNEECPFDDGWRSKVNVGMS